MRCPQSCALALSAFLVGQIVQGAEPPADLVVLNGKIVTVNPHSSIVEAAAVREGRFVAVGANSKVKKLVGDQTRVIDARGKTVVPGLIETHVHAIGVARDEAVQPFVQLSSIAEIQQWVRQQAQTTPKDEWVQIPRIDLTRLREGRLPTRSELDAATAEHPVVFNWQYGSRQIQVLNTAALRAANIARDTPDPTGGKTKIVKDAQGEPQQIPEPVQPVPGDVCRGDTPDGVGPSHRTRATRLTRAGVAHGDPRRGLPELRREKKRLD